MPGAHGDGERVPTSTDVEVDEVTGMVGEDERTDLVGAGHRTPVDRGDDVAELEVMVRRPTTEDVGDHDAVADVRHRVAESGQCHFLGRVLGVTHQQVVEAAVRSVRGAADHVALLLDADGAVQGGEQVPVEVGVAVGDLHGEEEQTLPVGKSRRTGDRDDVAVEGGGVPGGDDHVRDPDERCGDQGGDEQSEEQRRGDGEDPTAAAPDPAGGAAGRRGSGGHVGGAGHGGSRFLW